jgi:hypothetical protein
MSGDTSPKDLINPMDENEKFNSSEGKLENRRSPPQVAPKGIKRTTHMRRKKKMNWTHPMMKCLTLSGRHGRRNKN